MKTSFELKKSQNFSIKSQVQGWGVQVTGISLNLDLESRSSEIFKFKFWDKKSNFRIQTQNIKKGLTSWKKVKVLSQKVKVRN